MTKQLYYGMTLKKCENGAIEITLLAQIGDDVKFNIENHINSFQVNSSVAGGFNPTKDGVFLTCSENDCQMIAVTNLSEYDLEAKKHVQR